MKKQRLFKLSEAVDKVLLNIQAKTDESLTRIVEKGLYYYAKQLEKEDTKNRKPKTLLDVDLDSVEYANLDVPFTLDASGLDLYGGKRRRKWTDADVKQLLKMRYEGKSLSEIASYLGRPKASVNKKLWELKKEGE